MDIKIHLFGLFSEINKDGFLIISTKEMNTVEQIKTEIKKKLSQLKCNSRLLEALDYSALADETKVLQKGARVINCNELSILPPVSGG